MKKLITLFLSVFTLAACATTQTTTSTSSAPKTVKVGVVGSQQQEIWEFVAEKAKKENIKLEVVSFNDYKQPNIALNDGSLDINAFQHRAYLAQWNKDSNGTLKEIGVTFITPLYFFSTKHKSLKDVPAGGKVLVPSEVAIQGRALLALQTEGLITLKDGGSTKSNVADITSNPKNIEIIEAESAQAPRLLQDVDAAAVNGAMAKDAGIDVKTYIFSDADHLNLIPKDRYNIIVAKEKDAENETLKKIVSLFQQDDVAKKMNEVAEGMFIPVWGK